MARSPLPAPLLSGDRRQRLLAGLVLVLGLCSVAPLLAWVYGLGTFSAWFWSLGVPGLIVIVAVGWWATRAGNRPALAVAIAAGALGGLAGTILYDLVRVPFLAAGYRLFAPISSYGLLILDAGHGSQLTDTLGWFYNLANGIAFGVAYATFGLGRRWWYAIPWALFLETMTIVTPYAAVYGIAGHLDILAIAYGAHVFYGAALGLIVQRAATWRDARDAFLNPAWAVVLTALVVVLVIQPWQPTPGAAEVAALPPPAVIVKEGRFEPEWTRIALGDCLLVANRDDVAYQPSEPGGAQALRAGTAIRYCFASGGIKRVQLSGIPYSGGFVIVDPAMALESGRP